MSGEILKLAEVAEVRDEYSAGMGEWDAVIAGGLDRGTGSAPPLPAEMPGWPAPWRSPPPTREYAGPAYSERFKCIASACEDTCCSGWAVPIDQGTYEKYRTNDVMKAHVGTLIVLNTNHSSTADYARIPLTGTDVCSFLDSERLCGIQKQLGAEMLSNTCAIYPRAVQTVAGRVEKALNLSCPEAARLALLDENLLGDGLWRANGAKRYATVRADVERTPQGHEARLMVREFALLLLSDRSYPLWQRLYLLGPLMRRLQTMSKAKRGGNSAAAWCEANAVAVAHVLAESARGAIGNKLRPVMEAIEAQPAQQLQLVMEMLRMRVFKPPSPLRFLECVQDFERGLKTATATSEEQILAAYSEGYRLFYKPLMDRRPHLLENYLTNHLFKNNYPFGRQPEHPAPGYRSDSNTEREHLSLCVHAALAQTMLIGMAAHYRENFGCDHVVKLVQSLARAIEHSKEFLDQLLDFVEARELDNPRGIALLLRQDG